MKPARIVAFAAKEAWEMWLVYLIKRAGEGLDERETALTKSSFMMGWETRGIHEAREDKDVKSIAWYMADCTGERVTWGDTIYVDPQPYECYANAISNADKIEPEGAPHSWQPLVLRKVYHASKD
jgi:hypothetical protein